MGNEPDVYSSVLRAEAFSLASIKAIPAKC